MKHNKNKITYSNSSTYWVLLTNNMARFKFQIGVNQGVTIDLPSKRPGDRDVFIGAAKVKVKGLNSKLDVLFSRGALKLFFDQVNRAKENYKGRFKLESINSNLKIEGDASPRGHFFIKVSIKHLEFTQPDNTEWFAEIRFASDLSFEKEAEYLKLEIS